MRLHGKLALSYALTTIAALSVVVFVYIAGVFVAANVFLPQFVALGLSSDAGPAATYFVHGAPDAEGLGAWLRVPNALSAPTYEEGSLAVTDLRENVLASIGTGAPRPGSTITTGLSGASAAGLRRVLQGGTGDGGLSTQEPGGALIVMVPVAGPDHRVVGALVQRIDGRGPSLLYWGRIFALYVVPSSLLVIVIVGLVAGAIFGSRTARQLTGRFSALSDVVDRWRQDDFSRFVDDPSDDEIGQLGRELNRMAEQLRDLLRARRELAVLEERNRLARELHDSVKQQVFALSMEVSAAGALLVRDGNAAGRAPLDEAERLVHQVQRELTALIGQLRPAAMEDRPLGPALQTYVTTWSRQTGIAAETAVELDGILPPAVEETLFRVAQEALSNVARHSGASRVAVRLVGHDGTVTLAVADDGRGLDLATAARGVGLESMRERAQAAGGELILVTGPGGGTTVEVRLGRGPG
jgi:NarL family two-component system sensor histidine kinase LiaS